MGDVPENYVPANETGQPSATERASESLGATISSAGTAAVLLALTALHLLAQALRALLVIAPAILKTLCAALPFYAGTRLYPVLAHAYGDDVPASLLALALVTYVPAAMFVVSRAWGALLLAGGIELILSLALPHVPAGALALVPAVVIASVVFQLLREPDETDAQPDNDTKEQL